MLYTQRTLLPEEKILYATKPHYMIFYQGGGVCLVLALLIFQFIDSFFLGTLLLVMGLFSFVNSLIGYYCSEYVITNQRIVMKMGLMRRKSLELFLDRVEGVYIEQSIVRRGLNFGTVIIGGIGGTKNPFFYIPDPLKFRSSVQQLIQRDDQ